MMILLKMKNITYYVWRFIVKSSNKGLLKTWDFAIGFAQK